MLVRGEALADLTGSAEAEKAEALGCPAYEKTERAAGVTDRLGRLGELHRRLAQCWL
jgi:hypothetical protein